MESFHYIDTEYNTICPNCKPDPGKKNNPHRKHNSCLLWIDEIIDEYYGWLMKIIRRDAILSPLPPPDTEEHSSHLFFLLQSLAGLTKVKTNT